MELMSWAIILITNAGRDPGVVNETFPTQEACMQRLEVVKQAVWVQERREPEIACFVKVEPDSKQK